jgi:hypothetical protein
MKSQVEIVTPELAKLYLQNNDGNRPLRKSWIDYLSESIKRGEWQATHQGIAFSKNGRLLDGQHRLHAIIKANIPVNIFITRNVNESAFKVLDCGAKRTISDLTHMNMKTSEACRAMAQIIFNSSNISAEQALKVYETGFGEIHDDLVKSANTNAKIVCSAGARVAATCLIMNGVDSNYVKKVYTNLAHNNYADLPPIALAFLKQISMGKISARVSKNDLLARCLKVFNPIYENQSQLRVTDEDWNVSAAFCRNVVKSLIKEN